MRSRDKECNKSQKGEKVNKKKPIELINGTKRVPEIKQPRKVDLDNRSSFNTSKNPKVNLEN